MRNVKNRRSAEGKIKLSKESDSLPRLSPAEQEANAARLEAEAQKALAEARKATAEAEAQEHEATQARLKAERAVEMDERNKATDEYAKVYRFNGSVTEKSVRDCMHKLTEWHRRDPGCTIEIIFSSPGGSIFDGMELFDFIRDLSDQGHTMITGSLGMAASMAGILLQAGDKRWMGRETWILIHRAAFFAGGSTYDVEDQVKLVKRIEKRIIEIFTERSNLSSQKIRRNWKRKDWWIESDEAEEYGLVDEVRSSSLPSIDDVDEDE